MKQETVVVLDFEGYGVSFANMRRLIEFFEYGEGHRVAIELLALTGMRVSELDSITINSFWQDFIVWQPGKNQSGYRKEQLPAWFLREIDHYLMQRNIVMPRASTKATATMDRTDQEYRPVRLFPFTAMSLRRFITRFVRPQLGGDFLKKRRVRQRGRIIDEYIIQAKSFRHTYACKEFYEAMDHYGQELALHMVGSRMKHSTNYMTARHYCSDVRYLKADLDRYKGISMGDILQGTSNQTKLSMFGLPAKVV